MERRRTVIKNVLSPLRNLLRKLSEHDMMLVLSLFVGVACGLAAVLLKSTVEWIHTGLTGWFGNNEIFNYLYLIYPGVGMLLAMLFVRYVIRDDIGH